MKKNTSHCYMAVTQDKYQLPICVCDSVKELSEIMGVDVNSVYAHISRQRIGKIKHAKYIRIEMENCVDEE